MSGRQTDLYDLRVTVERIEGRSVCGLSVGDYFELTESSRLRIPAGKHFCIYALQSVLPFLAAKERELGAARLAGGRLALLRPGSRGAAGHVSRAHRAPEHADRRAHVREGRELGLAMQTNKRPGAYAELAGLAEDGGFDVVTVYNDLFWFQPSLPALLEIARETERVRVGPSCLNPFLVHPVELAGQVATLDPASGGRGLPRARRPEPGCIELGVEQRRPVVAIREAWEVVSRLLAGERSGFAGSIFRLPPGQGLAYTPERPSVPLLVGTWSPHLTAFARKNADELKLGGSANPDLVRLTGERLGSAQATASGSSPAR